MDLLLSLTDDFLIILLGLLVSVAGLFCWRWKRLPRALNSFSAPTHSLELREDTDPTWLQKPHVHGALAECRARGFEPAGSFVIDGPPEIRVLGLMHPTRGVRICIYEHASHGTTVDVCAALAEGTELTVSNATPQTAPTNRPGTEQVYLPGKTVGALFAEFDQRVQGRWLRPPSGKSFQEEFLAAADASRTRQSRHPGAVAA